MEQSKVWLPIKTCDQCHKSYNYTQGITVAERKMNNRGIRVLTGKQLHLCPGCGYKYMNGEIRNLTDTLDNKYKLEKWNKTILDHD